MMADKKENPHAGHRQRMRDKFLKEGSFDSFAPHQILEMMLYYSSPRIDTNELAHALIDKFGSIKDVIDAPYDALTSVDGIGQ
jgi:DNA repair protein RadC